ncbi:MAG: glycosyltransferase [Fusobacteria bacterium]|nr:glycosyltransferase [Fusobacteriota bacterium]
MKHCFVIIAYKDSPYLERCILSLINQKYKSEIVITTSTPSRYIENLSSKYHLPLFVREGVPNIQDDWNFGFSMAQCDFVTLAHQDDVYLEDFSRRINERITQKSILLFTDYQEVKGEVILENALNLKIKKWMLLGFRVKLFSKNKIFRRWILAFGSPICCPSVTYNLNLLGREIFTSQYKCNLDWDTWVKCSKLKGNYEYIPKTLMYHQIHEESETSHLIKENIRQSEDYEMFKKFWPKFIARKLVKVYAKSLESNEVEL